MLHQPPAPLLSILAAVLKNPKPEAEHFTIMQSSLLKCNHVCSARKLLRQDRPTNMVWMNLYSQCELEQHWIGQWVNSCWINALSLSSRGFNMCLVSLFWSTVAEFVSMDNIEERSHTLTSFPYSTTCNMKHRVSVPVTSQSRTTIRRSHSYWLYWPLPLGSFEILHIRCRTKKIIHPGTDVHGYQLTCSARDARAIWASSNDGVVTMLAILSKIPSSSKGTCAFAFELAGCNRFNSAVKLLVMAFINDSTAGLK